MSGPAGRHVYLKMRSLEQAREMFLSAFEPFGRLEAEEVDLEEALNRVTAGAVMAELSSPREHLAAMDGIALKAEKTFGARPDRPVYLDLGKDFFPVNTGHVLPRDCDAVAMIEHVFPAEGEDPAEPRKIFLEQPVFPWQHVRKLGEDLVATELILPAGARITAFDLGALSAGGIYRVKVRRKPRVAVIPTGDEVVGLDEARLGHLKSGQVVESNGLVLAGLIEGLGGEAVRLPPRPDKYETIKAAIAEAVAAGFDLVMVNAGSSAGTADYTASAVAELGEVLVHGVGIMPGKPTVLGRVEDRPVVGNPGYPVSAVVSFEQFVAPLLSRMLGTPLWGRATALVKPVAALPSKLGVEEFIRVKIGRVGENLLAVPLHRGAGSITSLTKADGIIRVPAMTEGLEAERPVPAELLKPLAEIENTIVAIGSHDNALDLLSDLLRRHDARFSLTSGHVGSLGGLKALARSQAHLAGTHLLDPETGEYNKADVRRVLPGRPLKLVHLVNRVQGFIVPAGNPKGIKALADLARPGLVFVNRQAGSGTRVLLDYLLQKNGLKPEDISGYDQEEYTHMNVAAAVLSGRADVGLGILAAARALKLDFIPLGPELYQLAIPAEHFESPKIQALMEVIRSKAFQDLVESLGGYGLEGCGEVVYEQ